MFLFFSLIKRCDSRFCYFILGIFFFQNNINAQLGINGGYLNFDPDEWVAGVNEITGENFDNMSGYQIGVDYRIRIKKVRVEFFPTITYSGLKNTSGISDLNARLLGFHLNTNIYLFDLEGDCDCPTWSKSGNIFQKGFFLQAAPGVNNFDIKVENENKIDGGSATFVDVGVGAGLDIGVSEFITVTPSVRFHLSPKTEWELKEEGAQTEFPVFNAFPNQFYAGIRIGLNFKK